MSTASFGTKKWLVAEIKSISNENNKNVSSNMKKAELIKILTQYDRKYEICMHNVSVLSNKLAEKNLPTKGKKKQLIHRLWHHADNEKANRKSEQKPKTIPKKRPRIPEEKPNKTRTKKRNKEKKKKLPLAYHDKAVDEKLKELKELNNKKMIIENKKVNISTKIMQSQKNQSNEVKYIDLFCGMGSFHYSF